eukprot:6492429-Amphidinium_carterae.2
MFWSSGLAIASALLVLQVTDLQERATSLEEAVSKLPHAWIGMVSSAFLAYPKGKKLWADKQVELQLAQEALEAHKSVVQNAASIQEGLDELRGNCPTISDVMGHLLDVRHMAGAATSVIKTLGAEHQKLLPSGCDKVMTLPEQDLLVFLHNSSSSTLHGFVQCLLAEHETAELNKQRMLQAFSSVCERYYLGAWSLVLGSGRVRDCKAEVKPLNVCMIRHKP